MRLNFREPTEAGRYVVFVPCQARQVSNWCEPMIASWHDDKWHIGNRPVYGWIGPLPVATTAELMDRADQDRAEQELAKAGDWQGLHNLWSSKDRRLPQEFDL